MAMDREPAAIVKPSAIVLPSRSAAMAACRDAMEVGPLLITGAAGVGKTWMVRQIQDESRLSWVGVDVSLAMSVSEFLLSILAGLGENPSAAMPRVALSQAIAGRSGDGRRLGLVVDEAHGASDEILEEIRLLSNRFGRPDGFAAMILCGQTPLARRVETRAMEGFESRLAGRVHLLPLDDREARTWAESRLGGHRLPDDSLEDLVRETGGIPSKIDRGLASLRGRGVSALLPAPAPVAVAMPAEQEPVSAPSLLPAKPPLHVEDGMIEVGWDSEDDALELDDEPEIETERVSNLGDEPVDDHYAALQAWDEWTKNQGRAPSSSQAPVESIPPGEEDLDDESTEPSALEDRPGTWAEGPQGFGPYSQLFARSRTLKGSAE